ncbi:GMC family oxidoreductase N-terminal domain-containing protein [Bosea sp. 124]|uniref:GMC family oxidoreductase n=1 Tax=Bosea sp. 124 TaxID=2135642 RepID=UPI000D38EF41|nr:GMC family oxidoreductase N-terminal domain-containing protein [Bosea sp. 124]PTM39676.1 choline dehydrogenase-like flavoprotein [Bosea sp. 124]
MAQPDTAGRRTIGTYDYVVIGAGSAGCVMANRLSRDPKARVLVLEAGGRDNWIWFHIPVGYLFAIGNPRADWLFKTEPQAGLGGRALPYPRGRVLGGSSSINAMVYMRGQAADYDGWRQLGLTGWGWDDVLPYFLKHEDHAGPGDGGLHKSGGEWRVEHPRVRWAILDAIREAAESAGIARIDDFNTGDNEGSSYFQVNQRRGRRLSSFRAFLRPVLDARTNLRLEMRVMVERVVVEDGRAKAVEFTHEGEKLRVEVTGEVVLSAGSIGSPALLERSGIGDGERLRQLGIATVADLPGVGENLQDHLQIRPVYKVEGVRTLNSDYAKLWRRPLMALEYAALRSGPLTMAPSQVGAFAKSSPEQATANLQYHFQPLSLDSWGSGLHPFDAFTASVCNLRPTSRGHVHLKTPHAEDAPAISPNYLDTEADRQVAIDAMKLTRRIVAQAPLARFRPQEHLPGPAAASDAELLDAAARLGTTIFHPVGTAKMGREDDARAVLDERLRVRGVRGLRVIDASAMPAITSGNTANPTMMIAEKGAAMMLEDARAR